MTVADDSSCQAVVRHLTALVDGELTGETANAVRAHLDACFSCAQTYQEIVAVGRLTSAADAAGAEDDVWATLRPHLTPAALDAEALPALQAAINELRSELRAARADVAVLRFELANRRDRPPTASPPRLFPYASPTDPPLRLT